MDVYQRVQEAQAYADRTKARAEQERQLADDAKGQYERSLRLAPDMTTLYEQSKAKYLNTPELEAERRDVEKMRELSDNAKTALDKVSQSIRWQFAGTGMSQDKADELEEAQTKELSSQFSTYQANYQQAQTGYEKRVEKAFNTSIDIANKDYDAAWQKIRNRANVWSSLVDSSRYWGEMSSGAQTQLFQAQAARDAWELRQRAMRLERELQEIANRNARRNAQRAIDEVIDRQGAGMMSMMDDALGSLFDALAGRGRSRAIAGGGVGGGGGGDW